MSNLPPGPLPSRIDLASQIPAERIAQGAGQQRDGRVLSAELRHRGRLGLVVGRVQGSASRPFSVHVELSLETDGRVVIDGDCSCPVGYNCQHVAAVLLQILASDATAPVPGNGHRGSPPDARDPPGAGAGTGIVRVSIAPGGAEDPGAAGATRLLYLIEPGSGPGALAVILITGRPLPGGGLGEGWPFDVERARQPHPPPFLGAADAELVWRLAPTGGAGPPWPLRAAAGARMLGAMLETGRCHWANPPGSGSDPAPAIALGAVRPATFAWRLEDDGRQRLAVAAEPPITTAFALAPPWYLDLAAGRCGPLDTGLAPEVAESLIAMPALTPEQAVDPPPALLSLLAACALPAPRAVPLRESTEPPVPRLRLLPSEARPSGEGGPWPEGRHRPARASLAFEYAGLTLPPAGEAPTPVTLRSGEGLVRVHRDARAEAAALATLTACGLRPWRPYGVPLRADATELELAMTTSPEDPTGRDGWLRLLAHEAPDLRAAGWRIEVAADFDHRLLEPEHWYGSAAVADGDDPGGGWLDVDIGIVVDGTAIALLPVLQRLLAGPEGQQVRATVESLAPERDLLAPAPGGGWLRLPGPRVQAILRTLVELQDPELRLRGDALRLSMRRAGELEALGRTPEASVGWRWQGAEHLRALADRIREFRGIEPPPPPDGFRATLRPYQRQGLGWLQYLRSFGFNGILADDMGLGKTVQALAHLLMERDAGRTDRPSLVVAPTSVVPNWALEARRFAPHLRVLILHGAERHRRFEAIDDHELVITSHALVRRDAQVLAAHEYHLLILDEAQAIKNPRAQIGQALRALRARHRLCLTGTPLENHLGDLWSLFDFLEPGLLGGERQFRRLFRIPIEKERDAVRGQALATRIAPFLLRRTKEEVLDDLPDKVEMDQLIELAEDQRDLYETIRLSMNDKVRKALSDRGFERSRVVILEALLKLRQVCCDPRLVKLESARRVRRSAKLERLMELLPELVEEGRRVLLFSQFTAMLALIETALAQAGIPCASLTGRTRDRLEPVRRFQAGEVPVFLVSLKAGGTGLNLTAADTVIHYDPWWNPAVETQATDRAHRIGQEKKVFVFRLVTAGTVEQRILSLHAAKRGLAASTLVRAGAGGAAAGGAPALGLEALEQLLEPLG